MTWIIARRILGRAGTMEEIFKRILDTLKGANFWIVLVFLAVGIIWCLWIGTTKRAEKEVLRRKIAVSLVLLLLAGGVILVNHFFFQREPVFSKNLTGILVMRIVGDDEVNSLQGGLVKKLNVELQNDPAGKQIEVHAGREMVDENSGLDPAHERARTIGQRLNAKLVIWGGRIDDKRFYPRITVVNAPKDWSVKSERTRDVKNIDELHLPEERVDEPFYLIHFASGYSYYDQGKYKEGLPHFEAALSRSQGGSPNELADLQFFTGVCVFLLGVGQKDMTAKLQEAIGLYEEAAKVYEGADQKKWAATQNNLAAAYASLPTGDPAENLQKAIAVYDALRVRTEMRFPLEWAVTQNNLAAAYASLPTGDPAENLQKAIAALEAVLRVRTEKDFHWAVTQNNLGLLYDLVPGGNRTENLKNAKACFESALRVYTENNFPDKHRATAAKLADVELQLRRLRAK